jgi:multidrug efflux pump subunit AcrA (membrane-fusion protein)
MADAEEKLGELKDDLKLFKQAAAFDGVAYLGQFSTRAWSGNDPKTVRIGEKATAGSTLLTVIKPGKMRLAMDLPEAKFKSVKADMKAAVVPLVLHQKLDGKTEAPSPIAKASGLELDIDLGDVDPIITPGMKADVFIDAGSMENVLLVPSKAVSDSKVWLKGSDGKPTPKRVTTGQTSDDRTEIIDGLSEGDEILEQAQK